MTGRRIRRMTIFNQKHQLKKAKPSKAISIDRVETTVADLILRSGGREAH
jgi:hypothetical protein